MKLYLEILLCAVLTVIALAFAFLILHGIWEIVTKRPKDEKKDVDEMLVMSQNEIREKEGMTQYHHPGTTRPEEGIPLSGRE